MGLGSRSVGATVGSTAAAAVDGAHPVVAFLREAGLGHYAGTLLRSGFDEMETLMDVEDADLRELGIPSYHIVRIRRRLQDLRSMGTSSDVDEDHPVVAFLREAGLCQYARALLQSGFDDMETLLEIEDADMKDLGIPRGHAVKLKKRLRERQGLAQGLAQGSPCPVAAPWHSLAPLPLPQLTAAAPAAPLPPVRGVACRPARPLEDHVKSAVERSWERVKAHGVLVVGELLYRHLFEITPAAMEFFPPEVRHRYREWDDAIDDSIWESAALRKLFAKVVNAVGYAVAGLHEPTRLVPMLTQLGARHISYKVSPEHWDQLGEALNRTLRQLLGEDFTPEVEMAWSMEYSFIAAIMIQGLRSAQNARAGTAGGSSETSGLASLRPGEPTLRQKSGDSVPSSAGALISVSLPLARDSDGSAPAAVAADSCSTQSTYQATGDEAAGELPSLLLLRPQHPGSGQAGSGKTLMGLL